MRTGAIVDPSSPPSGITAYLLILIKDNCSFHLLRNSLKPSHFLVHNLNNSVLEAIIDYVPHLPGYVRWDLHLHLGKKKGEGEAREANACTFKLTRLLSDSIYTLY